MINDLECPVKPDLANDCKQLLSSWAGRTITQAFDIDICRLACKHDVMDEYRWKPEPSMPADWSRYLGMSVKDRRIFMDQNPLFLTQGKVAEYLTNRDRIITINKRNLALLQLWIRLPIANGEVYGLMDHERVQVERNLNTYSGRMS